MKNEIKAYAVLAKIIALQTEAQGMVASNQLCLERNEVVAYVDDDFNRVAEKPYELSEELMNMGVEDELTRI